MLPDEITSKGIPFQTAVFPPPRNVGTPDSADTPAPVSTSTRLADAKRDLSSLEIPKPVVCMLQVDVSKAFRKVAISRFGLDSIQ
jgi:hypothetical protein